MVPPLTATEISPSLNPHVGELILVSIDKGVGWVRLKILPANGHRLKSKISKTYWPESKPTKSSNEEV